MRRTYQCAECGNTSSVPMRCCGVLMIDEEERVAHIHAEPWDLLRQPRTDALQGRRESALSVSGVWGFRAP